ncbi:MAG: LamG domain-containing protein [Sedimentisphaerales bacterium]|nr:LamG domain-containing protein [Sedimentisphaerales bacterium]
MNKLIFIMLCVVLLLFVAPLSVRAAVTYGDHVTGLYNWFYITDASSTWISCGQGPAFDPTHTGPDGYDRVYLVNDSDNATTAGLYSVDIYNGTYSGILALSGNQYHAQDCIVDPSGNAYVIYDYTPQVFKVTDPSGAAIVTQMLGNYDAGGDDDPFCIDLVPPGFNVGGDTYEAGLDLVVFDNGINDNGVEAVLVIDKTSTVASPLFTVEWSSSAGINMYGTCSEVDGYAYAAFYGTGTLLFTDTVGSDTLPYISRMKSDGVWERVFLNDPTMELEIDNTLEANPADGSLWMPIRTPGTQDHVYYRIDAANAVSLGGGDYLAEITAEVTLTGADGYNVVTNGFGISPDGKYLAVCAADGRDSMYVFSILSGSVNIDPVQLELSEAGPTTGSYTVACSQEPGQNVYITATPSSAGTGSPDNIKLNTADWGDPISLTFTTGNWSIPQTVAVTIKDDGIWNRPGVYDEDTYTLVVEHTSASGNPAYDGVPVADFTATVTDDDFPELEVSVSNNWNHVEEGGFTDSYVIQITGCEPDVYPMIIEVNPDNAEVKLNGLAAGATLTLSFTAGNWATPQTVNIEADDDGDSEDYHTSVLTQTVSGGVYDGYSLAVQTVWISDDEIPAPPLYEDMVLYTPLNGNTLDFSGLSNNGIPMGGPGYDTGRFGQAVDLDGVNDYVEVNLVADDIAGSQTHVSVSKWVKTTDYADKYIVACNTADKGNVVLIGMQNGLYKAYDGANHFASSRVDDDQWHHLAFTRSGSTTKLYIDGIAEATYSSSFVMNSNDLWSIGQEWDPAGTSQHIEAVIDEVAVWKRTLSPIDILQIARDGLPLPFLGIIVSPAADPLSVTEGGDPNTYTLVPNRAPSADVQVTATPVDENVDLGSGPGVAITLTFTTSNWDTAQTITVYAVDDEEFEGKIPHIAIINHSSVSGDSYFNNLNIQSVNVSITDNDCGYWGFLQTDLNHDCFVNLEDFALLALRWLDSGLP